MMKNKTLKYLGGGIVALLLLIWIGRASGCLGGAAVVKVNTETVSKRTIIETVTASGKIRPEKEVKITSEVSGELIELNVSEGDSVKKGQVLVKINPDLYVAAVERQEATVNSSRSSLANARARLIRAEAQFAQAKADYARQKQLYDKKVISQAEFDAAKATFESARADVDAAQEDVESARYNIQSAQASLQEARDQLRRTTVYAPVNGVVSRLDVEEGERVVGTSQFEGTEMMRIANLHHMEVRVDVSENDIIRVKQRDTASIEVDAYRDRIFKGVVTEVGSSAKTDEQQITTDEVTNFTVKIRILPGSYADLVDRKHNRYPFRPGMSASVDIRTARANGVTAVPIQAVTTREKASEKDNPSDHKNNKLRELVFVYEAGRVKAMEVKTGIQDDTYIEIKSDLQEDAEVVSAPYSAIAKHLKDGDEVARVEEKALLWK